MEIRLAVPADATTLAALQESTFRFAFAADNDPADLDLHCRTQYSPALQEAEIRDPQLITLVCAEHGQLVGFAQLRAGPVSGDHTATPAIEIKRFYLDAAWHGRGLAQQLMEQVFQQARAAGMTQIWLGVWERNPRAIRFYEKFGFAACGEHIFMVGTDPQRDLVLKRSV